MLDKLTVFDVETPSCHHDRICEIGVVRIEAGEVVFRQSFLVDPECDFSDINIKIHGIRPETVRGKPTFPQIWAHLKPYFCDGIVVAHNANFDLTVLYKTLAAYGLGLQPIRHIDTCSMVFDFYPHAPSSRLNCVCEMLNIHLEHHDAGSDAEAAAEVLLDMLKKGLSDDCVRTFSYDENMRHNRVRSRRQSAVTRGLAELNALLGELMADGQIDSNECQGLFYWMKDHSELLGNFPFDDIFTRLETILEDGVAEAEELSALFDLLNDVSDPVSSAFTSRRPAVRGVNVVLSGNFVRGEKEAIAADLAAQGALIQRDVTKKTRLLIVGALGNEQWAAGTYGNKVKRAMEMQGAGIPIRIMREDDFFNAQEEDELEQIEMDEDLTVTETPPDEVAQQLQRAIEAHLSGLGDLAKRICVVENATYIALKAGSLAAAQIAVKKSGISLSVKNWYCDMLPELAWKPTANKMSRAHLSSVEELLSLSYRLCEIAVKSLPAGEGFGCCHLYEQCSNARKCVQPNGLFSLACYYRKNLEQGKIFYGINKNT